MSELRRLEGLHAYFEDVGLVQGSSVVLEQLQILLIEAHGSAGLVSNARWLAEGVACKGYGVCCDRSFSALGHGLGTQFIHDDLGLDTFHASLVSFGTFWVIDSFYFVGPCLRFGSHFTLS